MLKRWLVAMLLVGGALRADAFDLTDMWWNPAESGWGVNVVQNDTTQFLTFFVYGPDGMPTWFVAATTEDAEGNYNGTLYSTTGTWFGAPWAGAAGAPAGTVTLTPIDTYHATLVYTLTDGPTVTKTIERQPLAAVVVEGSYSGSLAGKVTGCANAGNNRSNLRARYNLEVVRSAEGSVTLTFTFVDATYAGMVCTLQGALSQLGRLYRVGDAQYGCTGTGLSPGAAIATLESLHPTGQGVEGRWTASTDDGCKESMHFSAVAL